MNSLPLSPVVTSFILHDFTGKTAAYKSCICSAKLVPRPFRAQQNFFLVCIKFDKGGNSLRKHFESTANIRSNLQISLLSWNQTNTKWCRKVFLQLGRICFRILLRQSEIFSDFCKVLSQFAFRNMIVPLPKSQTRHPACAWAPLHLPYMLFWHDKTLQTPTPVRSFPCTYKVA